MGNNIKVLLYLFLALYVSIGVSVTILLIGKIALSSLLIGFGAKLKRKCIKE